MKTVFHCIQCGECCRHIDRVPVLKKFHDGNGVCKYLDKNTNQCRIYNQRPVICNVSQAYDKFFVHKYTEKEFLQLNYDACRNLRKERNVKCMYLSMLSKEQKELFLDLCIYLMNADNVVAASEELMLKQYCLEMSVEMRMVPKHKDVKTVLKRIKKISTQAELKKMTIELIALMYADAECEEEESKLIQILAKEFELSPHIIGDIIFVTRHLLLSYKMMNELVNE